MIVLLHGMPDANGSVTVQDIPNFRELITVKVWAMLGGDIEDAIGMKGRLSRPGDNVSMPTEHTLEFKFTHHDGTNYHYSFTGLIDGV
jgi:hypothetical protein